MLAEGIDLPPVLTLNAAVHSAEIIPDFWADKPASAGGAFLPARFGVVRPDLAEDVRILGPDSREAWGINASEYELRVRRVIVTVLVARPES